MSSQHYHFPHLGFYLSFLYFFSFSLQVNSIGVETATHDEVVQALKNAGERLTLTVKHFKQASYFLNRGKSHQTFSKTESKKSYLKILMNLVRKFTIIQKQKVFPSLPK